MTDLRSLTRHAALVVSARAMQFSSRERRVFSVRPAHGVFAFPFDMLRYDSCYPASQSEAAKIEGMTLPGGVAQTVSLATWQERGWTPSFERWASFGWQVLP